MLAFCFREIVIMKWTIVEIYPPSAFSTKYILMTTTHCITLFLIHMFLHGKPDFPTSNINTQFVKQDVIQYSSKDLSFLIQQNCGMVFSRSLRLPVIAHRSESVSKLFLIDFKLNFKCNINFLLILLYFRFILIVDTLF